MTSSVRQFPRFSMKSLVATTIKAAAGLSVAIGAMVITADDADARRKKQSRKSKKIESVVRKPEQPLVLVISLGRQRVNVYEGERVVRSAPISSGSRGRRTPKGIFSIIQKNRRHFSNLYNNAPMPFMQRITWSGIALHKGRLPGYPASHGCIRLPGGFARNLFKMTNMGTRVIVTQGMLAPRMFSHKNLLKPLPFDPPVKGNQLANAVDYTAPQAGSSATGKSAPASAKSGALTLNSVVGVSPANAAEGAMKLGVGQQEAALSAQPAGLVRLTRTQLEAARREKMTQLIATQATSQAELKTGREAVTQKRLALREAGKLAAIAKQRLRRLQRDLVNARRGAKKAARALIAFEKRYSNKTFDSERDAEKLAKATAREDQLEETYFGRSEDVDVAVVDVSDMKKRLANAIAQVGAARDALSDGNKNAKMKLTAYNTAKRELKEGKRAEKRRNKPLSIFVSRRTGKLYIKQGYREIYETPIAIASPDRPIGTHVYTALQFNGDKSDLLWSVVTTNDIGRQSRRRRGKKKVERISYPKPRADDALARLMIPEEARYEIAKLIRPGSSLIISDRRKSNETGKYTDYIISLN